MDYVVYVDSNNRNQRLYPNSNSYTLHLTTPITNITKVEVLSAMLPNVFSSQYLTLDITELRTPFNLVAYSLTISSNIAVPTSNAFYGSFAVVPVKVSGSVYSNTATYTNTAIVSNTEFYNANYRIFRKFPSRIDKLDRLTITWRQPNNGDIFIDKNFSTPVDLGRNMFILHFETEIVPKNHQDFLAFPHQSNGLLQETCT
jgi:hypothetical protein